MLKKFSSSAMVLAAGILAVGVVGCDAGDGEPCVIDEDCTKAGETCIEDLFASVCGCDPDATVDSCTEADANNVCHPERKTCELSCINDDECTSGEICDLATGACRDEAVMADCTKSTDICTTVEVCDTTSKKCVPDCKLAGNECATGTTCDASGLCVDVCGGNECTVDEYCNDAGTECVAKCTGSIDDDCSLGEVCDIPTGKCVEFEGCESHLDCANDGGFCNTSGDCETRLFTPECDGSVREFVNYPESNVCEATSGKLDACTAAQVRPGDKPEVAGGPTFYDGVSVGRVASSENCEGGPEVTFFARYYDAEGNVNESSLNAAIFQIGSSKTDYSSSSPKICGKTEVSGFCANETSDGTQGSVLFTVCRTGATDEEIAVVMEDKAKNPGNRLCIEIKPEHLNP